MATVTVATLQDLLEECRRTVTSPFTGLPSLSSFFSLCSWKWNSGCLLVCILPKKGRGDQVTRLPFWWLTFSSSLWPTIVGSHLFGRSIGKANVECYHSNIPLSTEAKAEGRGGETEEGVWPQVRWWFVNLFDFYTYVILSVSFWLSNGADVNSISNSRYVWNILP